MNIKFNSINIKKKKEEILPNGKKRFYYFIDNCNSRISNIVIFILRKFLFFTTKSIKIVGVRINNKLVNEFISIEGMREPMQIFIFNLKKCFFKYKDIKKINLDKNFFNGSITINANTSKQITSEDIKFTDNIQSLIKKDIFYFSNQTNNEITFDFILHSNCNYIEHDELKKSYINTLEDKNKENEQNFLFFDVNFNCVDIFDYSIREKVKINDENKFLDVIDFNFVADSCFDDYLIIKNTLENFYLFSNTLMNNFTNIEKKKIQK